MAHKKSSLILVLKMSSLVVILWLIGHQVGKNYDLINRTQSLLDRDEQDFTSVLIQKSQREIQTNPQEALFLLKKAMRLNPIDSDAYALMGLAYEAMGDIDRAKTFIRLAHKMTPREANLQLEIGQFWFRQNDLDRALFHWAIAFEMKPEFRARGFNDLEIFMTKPIYFAALCRLIETHDFLWWKDFFVGVANKFPNLEQIKTLYQARLKSGGEVHAMEHQALFNRLMRERQWSDAYFTWLNQLPKPSLNRLGNLYDGSFAEPPSNEGFGWRMSQDQAYQMYFRPPLGQQERGEASIYFNGSRPHQSNLLAQYLLLEPGQFTLKGEANVEQLKAGEGLQWQVRCLNGPLIHSSPLFKGSKAWHAFETQLNVPNQADCRVQEVLLKIVLDVNQPFTFGGRAVFRGLDIEKSP
jgi:tetratricopeptide (TPR) repeat protein